MRVCMLLIFQNYIEIELNLFNNDHLFFLRVYWMGNEKGAATHRRQKLKDSVLDLTSQR